MASKDIINAHLLELDDGEALGEIVLDLSPEGFQEKGSRSDGVPRGNYEMKCIAAEVYKSKSAGGKKNVKFTDVIMGPEGKGATIYTVHPLPVGEPGSDAIKHGTSFLGQRMKAIYSYLEKNFDEVRKANVKLKAEYFVGKSFYALLIPGETVEGGDGEVKDYSDSSKLSRYITKVQFEARPGPHETAPAGGGTSTTKTSKRGAALDQKNGAGSSRNTTEGEGAGYVELIG